MSRITTTISIARQGPSALFILAGGPAFAPQEFAPRAKSSAKIILAGGGAIFVKESVTTIKDAINAIRPQNRSP